MGNVKRVQCHVLIPKLRCDKQETRFHDTQAGRDRDGIKVLDFEGFDLLLFMLNRNLVQITLFGL